ncbi:MAG: beta-phosphoglucomutase family hydrolase [Deltaproteobacteria bacterium]|nr:beta-phosphoglucomutase family hydrolase [Deltaproteobacteria bacterium]
MAGSDAVPQLDRGSYDAALFDLDGVLTDTARVHAAAWKRLFDDFLRARAEREGAPFREFDIEGDYLVYVDGKPRYDGVRSFLASREIELPEGEEDDPPESESVRGLGLRKDGFVKEVMARDGVEAYPTSVELVRKLREQGFRTAVVSSSHNCAAALEVAGIADLFDSRVDGVVIDEMGIPGKPAPDSFLEAARQLGVAPERAIVVEDAISGVEAGRAGGFGLVIGVARKGDAGELARHGAHHVVADLGELLD